MATKNYNSVYSVDTHTGNRVIWSPDIWDEGWYDGKGYFHVYRPDHPKASSSGFVFRYWVVWWLNTGEIIDHPYLIHHKNEIKNDDVFENLQKLHTVDHLSLHTTKLGIACVCATCGDTFYLPKWRITQGKGKFCSHGCYSRYTQPDNIIQKRMAGIINRRSGK